jgi:hypothetical protein
MRQIRIVISKLLLRKSSKYVNQRNKRQSFVARLLLTSRREILLLGSVLRLVVKKITYSFIQDFKLGHLILEKRAKNILNIIYWDKHIITESKKIETKSKSYRCRYLLTALGLSSSTFRLCQQQL